MWVCFHKMKPYGSFCYKSPHFAWLVFNHVGEKALCNLFNLLLECGKYRPYGNSLSFNSFHLRFSLTCIT